MLIVHPTKGILRTMAKTLVLNAVVVITLHIKSPINSLIKPVVKGQWSRDSGQGTVVKLQSLWSGKTPQYLP